MDITLDKDNNTLISLIKNKKEINLKLNLNSTIVIEGFKIDSPGEYEIKGVFIEGISINKNFFYLLNIEKARICYLPIVVKELKAEEIEQIGNVNLLIVNISKYRNNQELSEIILNIEPQIIIPTYEKEEQLNEFLKARNLNFTEMSFLNKFSLTSLVFKNPTEEKTRVVLLNKNKKQDIR